MVDEWGTTEFWSRFAIASLVVWRLTHLVAYEDGPFDAIVWLRQKAGQGFFGKLMDCFYCLSFWIAAPIVPVVAWFGDTSPVRVLMVWIAVSGAACLLERTTAPPGKIS
jgi:hypothetical protein